MKAQERAVVGHIVSTIRKQEATRKQAGPFPGDSFPLAGGYLLEFPQLSKMVPM